MFYNCTQYPTFWWCVGWLDGKPCRSTRLISSTTLGSTDRSTCSQLPRSTSTTLSWTQTLKTIEVSKRFSLSLMCWFMVTNKYTKSTEGIHQEFLYLWCWITHPIIDWFNHFCSLPKLQPVLQGSVWQWHDQQHLSSGGQGRLLGVFRDVHCGERGRQRDGADRSGQPQAVVALPDAQGPGLCVHHRGGFPHRCSYSQTKKRWRLADFTKQS